MVRRVLDLPGKIVEVPITFVERREGTSKMNRSIVFEALWRVTGWGVRRRIQQLRRRLRRCGATDPFAADQGAHPAVLQVRESNDVLTACPSGCAAVWRSSHRDARHRAIVLPRRNGIPIPRALQHLRQTAA